MTLAVGPDQTLPCVQFGLFLIDDRGTPLVVLMRGPAEHHGLETVSLEVLAAEAGAAEAFLTEIRRLMVELNVFRGKVVSFGESHMGRMGAGPVVFHRRPDLARDQLVLPEAVLASIEQHVFGIAEHRERLRASDLHVKRGLLLHGPPGTGKTHTVRYLISRVRDCCSRGADCTWSDRPAPWPACCSLRSSCSRTWTSWPRSGACSPATTTRCCSTC